MRPLLDDLIDNNRHRINLLEDSVRLPFDGWFIRLRFLGATPRGGDASYAEDGISLIRNQNACDYNFVEDGLAEWLFCGSSGRTT